MKSRLFLSVLLMCVSILCYGSDENILVNDDDDVITAPRSVMNYQQDQLEKANRKYLESLDETDVRAVTSIQLQTGISDLFGEFARLRVNIGSKKNGMGGAIYGGIGHDWIFDVNNPDYIKDPYTNEAKKKLEWHVGLGFNAIPMKHSTISVLLDYCQSSYVPGNFCLNEHIEFSYYFLQNRLGAFASAGASLYMYDDDYDEHKVHTRLKFLFSVGLTFRLFK